MLVFVLIIGNRAKDTLFNKDNMQRGNHPPLTVVRFLLALSLTFGVFLSPTTLMNMLNDLTGVGDVCLVMRPEGMDATKFNLDKLFGSSCYESFKKDLSVYLDADGIEQKKLRMFLGLIQLSGFIFFLHGGAYLVRNVLAEQNLKHTTAQSVVMLIVSGVVIQVNGLLQYVSDLSDKGAVVVGG
ncbi:MAG: hypothetical protein HAW67_04160 [Endozoicomonadaceae bacterium]|nr:hypothetical protein [Endozoicomonadaceae bacterium]